MYCTKVLTYRYNSTVFSRQKGGASRFRNLFWEMVWLVPKKGGNLAIYGTFIDCWLEWDGVCTKYKVEANLLTLELNSKLYIIRVDGYFVAL